MKKILQDRIRIAIAQINPTVGDLAGNSRKIKDFTRRAAVFKVDIISFPELALTGYPPEDLLLKECFIKDSMDAANELAESVGPEMLMIVGFIQSRKSCLYNAAAVICNKKIAGVYQKTLLPNYGVFDEKRYFVPGAKPLVFQAVNINFGVNICEDIWHEAGPLKQQVLSGANLIININASPYYKGKIKERENIICRQAKENHVHIIYANLVGGQDELVFDGQSMVVDNKGMIIARAAAFKEDLLIVDLEVPISSHKKGDNIIKVPVKFLVKPDVCPPRDRVESLEPVAQTYQALVMGLRDYVFKNGFKEAVIGLSGGIDSSLVAALAVDALGKDNVTGVFMPSRYSSKESLEDAGQLASNLGIRFMKISIEQLYKLYLLVLEPHFQGLDKDSTEENLQARIRGNIMMALSNKFGWLVLATGNKSEMSAGYATLYGDMAGALAVIKDVPKTLVYALSLYRNSINCVIPQRVLIKEPTAELKPHQKDSDTLPVYDILDPILKAYVEEDKDADSIVSLGFEKMVVDKVVSMVDKSEYKRRQSPPGIKITPKAFGRDRRMPITNKYRG